MADDQSMTDQHVAELEAQIAELTAQLQKLTDLAARSQADLQNAKSRMEKDAKEIRQYAAEMILLALLPTIDNFQRAFTHLPEDLKNHEWVKGIVAIDQTLMKQLGEMGLKKMEALGSVVDPAHHDVVTVAAGEEGKVVEVLEDGYELHGKVIRPAKVKAGTGQ